jgi:hypothetical protein
MGLGQIVPCIWYSCMRQGFQLFFGSVTSYFATGEEDELSQRLIPGNTSISS